MSSKQIRVFLVDDDKMYLEILTDQLKQNLKMKHDIKTFSTGEECLEHLDENPDMIVLDYNLNKDKSSAKNGLEILKEIKSKNPDIEVIMLSGQDKIEVAVNAVKYGAFEYVVKSESAFLRTQNVITNIFNSMRLKETLKIQKMMTRASFGVIAFIILLVMILYIFFPGIWSLK